MCLGMCVVIVEYGGYTSLTRYPKLEKKYNGEAQND